MAEHLTDQEQVRQVLHGRHQAAEVQQRLARPAEERQDLRNPAVEVRKQVQLKPSIPM